MYINRHIKNAFKSVEKFYNAILLTGSRQVGKSTFLKHTYSKLDYISFDNWNNLKEIKKNPQEFFLRSKSFANNGTRPNIYYFRNSNKEEIDLLFYENNTLYPVEIKKNPAPSIDSIKSFRFI